MKKGVQHSEDRYQGIMFPPWKMGLPLNPNGEKWHPDWTDIRAAIQLSWTPVDFRKGYPREGGTKNGTSTGEGENPGERRYNEDVRSIKG